MKEGQTNKKIKGVSGIIQYIINSIKSPVVDNKGSRMKVDRSLANPGKSRNAVAKRRRGNEIAKLSRRKNRKQ